MLFSFHKKLHYKNSLLLLIKYRQKFKNFFVQLKPSSLLLISKSPLVRNQLIDFFSTNCFSSLLNKRVELKLKVFKKLKSHLIMKKTVAENSYSRANKHICIIFLLI